MSSGWRCRADRPYRTWVFLERGERAEHLQIRCTVPDEARPEIKIARYGLLRAPIEPAGSAIILGHVVTWERDRAETQRLPVPRLGLGYLVAEVSEASGVAPTRLYLVPFAARMISLVGAVAAALALGVASSRIDACNMGVYVAGAVLAFVPAAVFAGALAWQPLAALSLHRVSVPAMVLLCLGARWLPREARLLCEPVVPRSPTAATTTSGAGGAGGHSPSTAHSSGGGGHVDTSSSSTGASVTTASHSASHASSSSGCVSKCYGVADHYNATPCSEFEVKHYVCNASTYLDDHGCSKTLCRPPDGGSP